MAEQKDVECAEHGTGRATFVCRHLAAGGEGLGFHRGTDPEDPDAAFPDAWCDACEAWLEEHGGWPDSRETVDRIKLLCDRCYEVARERNWRQDDAALERLMGEAVAYLEKVQDETRSRFRLDAWERYDYDEATGLLVFSDGGQAKVVADIQIVGTVSLQSSTFMWSWANPSVLESVRGGVRRVRAFGEEHGYLKLACAHWAAEEPDGWDMTAVTAFLLKARGAYRSPDDGLLTFMVMTDVRWAQ